MPERAWAWSKRIMWGNGRIVSLDFGAELWKWDVSLYESAEGIRAALTRAGRRPFDDDSILFDATYSLVLDVVDAAGGVEQAHQRFHAAVEAVREMHAQWLAASPTLGSEGAGMAGPPVEAAWYALEELLVWARVLNDRLERRPVDGKYFAKQGLIPAMADGPRRDAVINARDRLLHGGVGEARYLSNLSLHMQSSQAGSKRVRIRSGKVVLPFPDCVTRSVSHRWLLTYGDGRDAVSFVDTLMAAVERFMDETIGAFEAHLPERFRQPSTTTQEDGHAN
jgi:hypothetical protein